MDDLTHKPNIPSQVKSAGGKRKEAGGRAKTGEESPCFTPAADPPRSALRDEPLYRVFKEVGLAFRQRALQRMREEGIDDVNPGATPLLLHLGDEDGLTLGELARRCGLENSTLTPLVDDLERARLVMRARAAEDRRVIRLYLTEQGQTREKQLRGLWFHIQHTALSGISDADLGILHRTLAHIVANLHDDPQQEEFSPSAVRKPN